jgi:hypothetical protein
VVQPSGSVYDSGVKSVEKERRRYDRATREEVERRRFPRVEPSGETHVEDANACRLGIVSNVSEGGFCILPESGLQAQAFGVGKQMELTLVGKSGSRTTIRATVVYRTPFAIGLEFL